MKSSLKSLVFLVSALVGVINVIWVAIGLSFPVFCEAAELFGAKAPGGTSGWANASEWCFTTYTSMSPLALIFISVATILGFSWLITNWNSLVARYWESPVSQPKSKDDYATKFQIW